MSNIDLRRIEWLSTLLRLKKLYLSDPTQNYTVVHYSCPGDGTYFPPDNCLPTRVSI